MARIDRIRPGQLRRRIQLQRKGGTADGLGGQAKTWTTFATRSSQWRPLSGRDRLQAEQVQSVVAYRVLIRFEASPSNSDAPFVTAGDRILYKATAYNIKSVVDVEDRRRWLELDLESGVAA